MQYDVVITENAKRDLNNIYVWMAENTSLPIANIYIDKINLYLQSYSIFPHRGTKRDDIRHNLRIIGYKKQITIAFSVNKNKVVILRLFKRGLDFTKEF